MDTSLRTILTAIIVFSLTACQGSNPTFPADDKPGPAVVHVYPVVPQEELEIYLGDPNTNLYMAAGLVGVMVDSAMKHNQVTRNERRIGPIKTALADDNLDARFQAMIGMQPEGREWIIDSVAPVSREPIPIRELDSLMRDNNVDAAVVLTADFYMTPGVDQLHIRVHQEVHGRDYYVDSTPRSRKSDRTLHYQSPVHRLDYRELRAEEKEAMAAEIEKYYAIATQSEPDKAARNRRAMERELEALETVSTVPEYQAILEIWTAERLKGYLVEARAQYRYMIALDWNDDGSAQYDSADRERIDIRGRNGKMERMNVRRVATHEGRTIYRSHDGDLYSLPESRSSVGSVGTGL